MICFPSGPSLTRSISFRLLTFILGHGDNRWLPPLPDISILYVKLGSMLVKFNVKSHPTSTSLTIPFAAEHVSLLDVTRYGVSL